MHTICRSNLFLKLTLLLLLSGPAGSAPAGAAEPAPMPSNSEVLALLRNAKIVDPSYKLAATVSGDEIQVITQRKPKSTDNECKIQAVLIGKTAFDAVKIGPQRTKVMFLDYDKSAYGEVTVKRAEVRLFGQGQLSEKDLLASLELLPSQPPPSDAAARADFKVVPGPLQANREMVLERMARLKEHGVNVSPFMNLFTQVEQAANTGVAELVQQRLDELNDRLKEQERVTIGVQETENAMRTGQDRPWVSPFANQGSAFNAQGNVGLNGRPLNLRKHQKRQVLQPRTGNSGSPNGNFGLLTGNSH
jgi:hypothetical protein